MAELNEREIRPHPKPVREEKQRKSLRRRNDARVEKMRARNFPDTPLIEPRCLVERELAKYQRKHGAKMWPKGWSRCWGRVEPAHVIPRGMGGVNSDRTKVVDLCHGHHCEQEGHTAEFEALYGLDLTAEAELRAANGPADPGGP